MPISPPATGSKDRRPGAGAARAVATAFLAACEDELQAPKPGNVHVFAGGHGMEAQHFLASAEAAAPFIAAPGAGVGRRILGAVEATWAAVSQNTNLGIVLLCAPLAHAALQGASGGLRAELARVLRGLDRADADMAFRAISLARPAGLGAAPEHDVSEPATTTLLEAMRAAERRDRVAYQYAHDFEDVFDTGLGAVEAARHAGEGKALTILSVYLSFLGAFPDSHIFRKHGLDAAEQVRREAREFSPLFKSRRNEKQIVEAALRWDASLKTRGLNPGTSADLTVATLFCDYLLAAGLPGA